MPELSTSIQHSEARDSGRGHGAGHDANHDAGVSPGLLEGAEDHPLRLTGLATLGTLSCMLVHEMNNVLTPVVSYARLSLDQPGDDQLARRAHTIALESAVRCQKIGELLLGYASDGSGASAAGVRECVDRAIACVPRELSKDMIETEIDIDRAITAQVPPTALEQIMLNLVLNARRAMPTGGRLRVSADCSTWNAVEQVRVSVKDTGVGIPAEELGGVQRPFARGAAATGSGGAGLGLALCRYLAERFGGTLRIESTPGTGTTVVVALPAVAAAQASAA